ncbi:TetR/AcrR family transcriptional regulator [Mycolicibacterium madagascariense]|uniref:TetR/AcrR family transcriptional regulator n=1 Tax=Mycolicibacterium madagascariense TaxID=212765 RepID=UPI0013CF59AD|nr:TetR/AcrR family transcriptional regulator [Mycolicibacterium madagascariense]MCV7012714.1 TetR/AcrR family transcriptional regulator [Mycolicibacterium madagascariense]
MPRPRLYDRDLVLDAAESLAVATGPAGVTTRAVASKAGVSNGAIYHSFGSRADLVAQTWLRAARGFLCVQGDLVEAALSGPAADPVDAVVAAADAPAVYYRRHPQSARLLVRVNRTQLLGDGVSDAVGAELAALDAELVALLVRLARTLWNRGDAAAVDAITLCVVDLPTAFLLSRHRIDDEWARVRLGSAVRATLADGPPPPTTTTKE